VPKLLNPEGGPGAAAANTLSLLSALQHGDSFFPSGAVAFSAGLETLAGEGRLSTADDVGDFLRSQLVGRWAGSDRAFLAAAHQCGADDMADLAAIDRLADAATLPAELRAGSVRAGAALLGVHQKLNTPGAAGWRARVRAGETPGHLPVVQGLCFAGSGLDLATSEAVSIHALLTGLAGAAIRLGCIGHIAGQQIISNLQPDIVRLLGTPAPRPEDAWSYAPVGDIAVMRHETHDARLFAN
jgi:urease accessory protein